jgi:TonB family protein
MKTIIRISALLALGALTMSGLYAAVEPVKIEPTTMPYFNPVLLSRGITEGQVALAIDVSAEGRLTDWLVLGYTDREMVNYCVDALKEWNITPARVDGRPVPSQLEVTIKVTAEGVVISSSGHEIVDITLRRLMGNPVKPQISSGRELDRLPARVSSVTPKYAEAAAKQGVRGKVQVHFYIDENGAVRMPAVDAGAQPYLSDIAVTAVRDWKFEPPTSHGKPVLVAATQEFDFSSAK